MLAGSIARDCKKATMKDAKDETEQVFHPFSIAQALFSYFRPQYGSIEE
jgi:hypothetical protein